MAAAAVVEAVAAVADEIENAVAVVAAVDEIAAAPGNLRLAR